VIALGAFVPVIVLAAQWPAQAQYRKAAYAGTVLLGRYLMRRNVEIAMARSAAPEASRAIYR
jgi:hypothetical protein